MLRLFVGSLFIVLVSGLTCYNGMKFMSGGSTGQSTEECSSSRAYCYNMSASAVMLVDLMKAGCSTWRCMLAQDTCIRTSFQGIPVSLCCCSTDRCNVGEFAGQNWNNNNNNNNNWNNQDNNNNNNNNNNWNNQGNQGGFNNNNNNNGGSSGGFGSSGRRDSHTREDVERAFKQHIDASTQEPMTRGDRFGSGNRGGFDTDGEEETFQKVDVRYTTKSPRSQGSGKFSSIAKGGGQQRQEQSGGEIEI